MQSTTQSGFVQTSLCGWNRIKLPNSRETGSKKTISARTGEYREAPAAGTSHPAILDLDDSLSTAEPEPHYLHDAQMVVTLHFHALDHLAAREVLLDSRVRRLGKLH
jgi:hypothetical protein